MGGAAIGGSVANKGQRESFERQRIAHLEDLVVQTYSTYVRTTASAYVEAASAYDTDQTFKLPKARRNVLIGEVQSANAVVHFVVDEPRVEHAADELEALLDELLQGRQRPDDDLYIQMRDRFSEAAGDSLNALEESY